MQRKVQEIILARRLSREAVEGGDPRALPEPDLLRPRPLRLRGGGALLLRQVGARHRPRRGGAAGRPAAEPRAAVAAQAPRGGQDAAALRARARWPSTATSSASRRTRWRPQPIRLAREPARGARRWRPRRSTSSRTFLAEQAGRVGGVRGRHDRHDHAGRAPAGAGARRRWSAGWRISTRARASAGRRGT